MKILLDECLPTEFRHYFPTYDVHSTEWAGLKGKKNGALIRGAVANGYSVILTIDQGIQFQQRIEGLPISIVIVRVRAGRIEALVPFVSAIEAAFQKVIIGEVSVVDSPSLDY